MFKEVCCDVDYQDAWLRFLLPFFSLLFSSDFGDSVCIIKAESAFGVMDGYKLFRGN
jgi:hypothetical protein